MKYLKIFVLIAIVSAASCGRTHSLMKNRYKLPGLFRGGYEVPKVESGRDIAEENDLTTECEEAFFDPKKLIIDSSKAGGALSYLELKSKKPAKVMKNMIMKDDKTVLPFNKLGKCIFTNPFFSAKSIKCHLGTAGEFVKISLPTSLISYALSDVDGRVATVALQAAAQKFRDSISKIVGDNEQALLDAQIAREIIAMKENLKEEKTLMDKLIKDQGDLLEQKPDHSIEIKNFESLEKELAVLNSSVTSINSKIGVLKMTNEATAEQVEKKLEEELKVETNAFTKLIDSLEEAYHPFVGDEEKEFNACKTKLLNDHSSQICFDTEFFGDEKITPKTITELKLQDDSASKQ